MKIKLSSTALCIGLLSFLNSSYAQTEFMDCEINPVKWPAHTNWFLSSPDYGPALIFNTKNQTITSISNSESNPVLAYGGSTTVSDNFGNLLFYSNGKSVFKYQGVGYEGLLVNDNLLADNEGETTGDLFSSATQGVITVKHPASDNYYIFKAGDADENGLTGLNYSVYSNEGHLLHNPIKLMDRTTEGIAATRHANGMDIWITVLDPGNGNLNSFLLTINGIEWYQSIISSGVGPVLSGDELRGGLAFSGDGTKFAQAHAIHTFPYSQQVTLYDFDNLTGRFSNAVDISQKYYQYIHEPYDIIFSPDNRYLFVSNTIDSLVYKDLYDDLSKPWTKTDVKCFGIEIGYDRRLYGAAGHSGGIVALYFHWSSSDLIWTTIPGTEGISGRGLPTMYIPQTEEPDIEEVGPFCVTSSAVDIHTYWSCIGLSAEDTVGGKRRYEQKHYYYVLDTLDNNIIAYNSADIIDEKTGVFNPSFAGVGRHKVVFEYGMLNDTIEVEVSSCIPTHTEEVEYQSAKIFPNPSSKEFTLKGPWNSMKIFSTDGSLVKSLENYSPETSPKIEHDLPSGIYMLDIQLINNKKEFLKLVVK